MFPGQPLKDMCRKSRIENLSWKPQGKKEAKESLDHSPPGTTAEYHESGWIQNNIFVAWFTRFVAFTNLTGDKPVILLDGHAKHNKSRFGLAGSSVSEKQVAELYGTEVCIKAALMKGTIERAAEAQFEDHNKSCCQGEPKQDGELYEQPEPEPVTLHNSSRKKLEWHIDFDSPVKKYMTSSSSDEDSDDASRVYCNELYSDL
ncbi:hypothetical protein PR048_010522 [Dryococelus australis]|uniref:DDE-1 domain-containing protein n=1 Tax=Dryococelus australis TaxID=614101 RepID=A0ABQ9I2Z7_9NEOP|nr:hypothetical protein PR048_010522 [Dryococelus australis]